MIELDSAHYDMIVKTATTVEHINQDMIEVKALLKGCPCKAVTDLQKEVTTLRTTTLILKGKLMGIGMVAGTIAGWIGSLIPGLIGGKP